MLFHVWMAKPYTGWTPLTGCSLLRAYLFIRTWKFSTEYNTRVWNWSAIMLILTSYFDCSYRICRKCGQPMSTLIGHWSKLVWKWSVASCYFVLCQRALPMLYGNCSTQSGLNVKYNTRLCLILCFARTLGCYISCIGLVGSILLTVYFNNTPCMFIISWVVLFHYFKSTYIIFNVPTLPVARSLEHSTILYEDPQQLPLLRLSWNKQDHNYLATFAMEKSEVCTKFQVVNLNNAFVMFVSLLLLIMANIFSWLYRALCTHHTCTAP